VISILEQSISLNLTNKLLDFFNRLTLLWIWTSPFENKRFQIQNTNTVLPTVWSLDAQAGLALYSGLARSITFCSSRSKGYNSYLAWNESDYPLPPTQRQVRPLIYNGAVWRYLELFGGQVEIFNMKYLKLTMHIGP
jgi:hypothetical protein